MPIEIEAKFRFDDHDELRRRLAALGAVRQGAVLERNTFFDKAERSLLAGDRGLRLRTCMGETGEVTHVLTYKGPREKGELKRREEIELEVTDSEAAAALVLALGYEPVLEFEKRRETWRVEGCKVELDDLPHLGRFVEIEGPSNEAVMGVRHRLGLSGVETVTLSYIGLLMNWRRETGSDEIAIAF